MPLADAIAAPCTTMALYFFCIQCESGTSTFGTISVPTSIFALFKGGSVCGGDGSGSVFGGDGSGSVFGGDGSGSVCGGDGSEAAGIGGGSEAIGLGACEASARAPSVAFGTIGAEEVCPVTFVLGLPIF